MVKEWLIQMTGTYIHYESVKHGTTALAVNSVENQDEHEHYDDENDGKNIIMKRDISTLSTIIMIPMTMDILEQR